MDTSSEAYLINSNDFEDIDWDVEEDIKFDDLDFMNMFESLDASDLTSSTSVHKKTSRSALIPNMTSPDALVVLKRRQKEIYRIRRVPETDVRHKYPLMLANVLNTSDLTLLDSFWNQFSGANIRLRKTILKSENEITPIVHSFQGLSGIVAYCSAQLQLLPDHITQLSNAQIHTRSDIHGSIISTKYCAKYHQIYELSETELTSLYLKTNRRCVNSVNRMIIQNKAVDGAILSKKKIRKTSKSNFPPTQPLQNYIHRMGCLPKLLPQPFAVSLSGRFTLYLNAMKQIVGVDIVASMT